MDPPQDKRVVFDIDGVLCKKDTDKEYANRKPHQGVLETLRAYEERGYYIILYTARNMNTHGGRIGRINATTAKTLLEWLEEYDVPHDEIYYGKPWCGNDGFYVDDKAIRPSELMNNSIEEIRQLLRKENEFIHS